ncbi:hypothetical protein COTS27_01003 [Spirochaetota bacterium]|nr:hypothetical protein COTS27_01003 [Spirochaetota bacterium]
MLPIVPIVLGRRIQVLILLVVLSILGCTTTSAEESFPDLATLISESNLATYPNLAVRVEMNEGEAPVIIVSGLTNTATGTPGAWDLAIDQSRGVRTFPSTYPIRAPVVKMQHELTDRLQVKFGSQEPIDYILRIYIEAAPDTPDVPSNDIVNFVDLIKESNSSNYPNLIVSLEAGSGDELGVITISGFTNTAGGLPGAWDVAIDQSRGVRTFPSTYRIRAPTSISPYVLTDIIEVKSGSAEPISYTLNTYIKGAAIDEWFTPETARTYLTRAKFLNTESPSLVSSALSFDGTNVFVSDVFRNAVNGIPQLIINNFPMGFAFSMHHNVNGESREGLVDPDGMGLGALVNADVGFFTIYQSVPSAGSDVTQTKSYAVKWSFKGYLSPINKLDIAATFENAPVVATDIDITANIITIYVTNIEISPRNGGIVTITPSASYKINTLASPITAHFINPLGYDRETRRLPDTLNVLEISTGAVVAHYIVIEYLPVIRIEFTFDDLTTSPLRIRSGGKLTLKSACKLFVPTTVDVQSIDERSVIASSTPLPAFYNSNLDASNNGIYTATRTLTVLGADGELLVDNFIVNVEFPSCTYAVFTNTGADAANAIEIDSAAKLELFSRYVVSYYQHAAKHYKVTSDIDLGLAGLPWSMAGSGVNGRGFPPIGMRSSGDNFRGELDCGNHTISNLYINQPTFSNIGFFGFVSGGASIKNCRLTGVNIKGGTNVGGLVGSLIRSTISNSSVTGVISGKTSVGGLVGYSTNNFAITGASTTGTVSGNLSVGGLVGYNLTSPIDQSFSSSTVFVIDTNVDFHVNAGGLIGNNYMSAVSASYATGSVTGKEAVGGLIGTNDSSDISSSYASGVVIGSGRVGGLIGHNSDSDISNSYAAGSDIRGYYYVGGLVGWNINSAVTHSYTLGAVPDVRNGGLFMGSNSGQLTHSYFQTRTAGSSGVAQRGIGSDNPPTLVTAGVTGLSGSELRVPQGTTAGTTYFTWDANIWNFQAGEYPRLRTVVCPMQQFAVTSVAC